MKRKTADLFHFVLASMLDFEHVPKVLGLLWGLDLEDGLSSIETSIFVGLSRDLFLGALSDPTEGTVL